MSAKNVVREVAKVALGLVVLVVGLWLMLALAGCGSSKKAILEQPFTPYGTNQDAPPVIAQTQEILEFPAQFGERGLSPIYFAFDQYEIRDQDALTLTMNAGKMAGLQGVVIEGHADERGLVTYNLALGLKRAYAARSYLIRLGVPAELLQPASMGEEHPADPGHNESAWSKNRRVEFKKVY